MTTPQLALDFIGPVQPPQEPAPNVPCNDGEPSTTPRKPVAPHTCNGCDATWTGVARAHCAAPNCHRTFASVALFDKHRSMTGDHGTCKHPASVTTTSGEWVMYLRDGIWRSPEMTAEQKTAAFGSRA